MVEDDYEYDVPSISEEEQLQLLEEIFNLTIGDKDLEFPQ